MTAGLSPDAESDIGVFHIIQRFPLTEIKGALPLLFVETDGQVDLHEGSALWVRARILERKADKLSTDLRTIGRLHDFQQIAWLGEPVLDEDRDVFVGAYLDARYRGTWDRPQIAALGWQPSAYSTVRGEFGSIARYFAFQQSARRWQQERFGSPVELEGFGRRLAAGVSSRRKDDFFSHLTQSRARWSELYADGEWTMPDLGERDRASGGGQSISLDRTMDLDEFRLIINREPNVAYKALFTLLAFGGVRISEALHMWQCDVIPAPLIAHLANRQQDALYVVVAHPAMSTYTGSFTRTTETRRQLLARQYGLSPRHDLQGYKKVGWKNPLLTDRDLKLSEVFWSSVEGAQQFAEYYAQIRDFHARNHTSERHPYLFVNMHPGEGFGEPIAYMRACKAFYRACARVGLRASMSGRRLHGLRHAYKHQLKHVLGLSEDHIQICMRHKSVESQEDYGRTIAEIHSCLSDKLDWKVFA